MLLLFAGLILFGVPAAADDAPEARALRFLAVEVPAWSRDHHCYSCHNNGDAARALFDAKRRGRVLPNPDPLADTARWLTRPDDWDHNGGEGPFSDKPLAHIQFASALRGAVEAKVVNDRAPLVKAAERLVADQADDGSWPIDDGGRSIGSPASYGKPLATLVARDTLRAVDPARFRDPIAKADRWLAARPVASVVDAVIALRTTRDPATRDRALGRIRAGVSDDGGWGPYVNAAPEPYDTALVVLALTALPRTPELSRLIAGGRAYLLATQLEDGGWRETTRPPGAESYAQRISTAGWATLALLATSPPLDGER